MSARFVAILAVIALLSTSACAAANPSARTAAPAPAEAARPAAPPPAPAAAAAPRQQSAGGGAPGSGMADLAQQGANTPAADRMIIRTVNMTIAVGDVTDVFHKVEALVGEQNGYLAGSQIRQDGDRLTATMTLRVPADNATYQATLERLRGLAERVVDESAQAQDVTDQYVDLDARLRTLRATEESLLQLMGKATKVEDIINVQKELTNVRTQIEQIQGQKQLLERRADMATITLTIREATAFTRTGWSPGATVEEAVRALGGALRGVVIFLIWLAVFTPIWGGFLLVIWGLVKLISWRVRRSGRRAGGSTPGSTPPTAAPAAPVA